MNIYANDKMMYGCTAKTSDSQRLAADLSPDLALTSKWGKTWLLKFKALKTKLVTFHHCQLDPKLPPVTINGCPLREALCLEHLLRLKLTPDLKWYSYI